MHGRRPPGSASPKSTSASARPPSWPGNQPHSTRGHRRGPRQVDRRAGQHDDDRAGLGGRHRLDQLHLAAGQGERLAVAALGLPVAVEADHHDGGVGVRGGGDRPLEGVGRLGRRAPQLGGQPLARIVERGPPARAAPARPAVSSTASPTGAPSTVSVASPLVLTLKRCAPAHPGRVGRRRARRPAGVGARRRGRRGTAPGSRAAAGAPARSPSAPRISTSTPACRRPAAGRRPRIAGVPRLAVEPGLDHDRRRRAARAGRRPPSRRRWA